MNSAVLQCSCRTNKSIERYKDGIMNGINRITEYKTIDPTDKLQII